MNPTPDEQIRDAIANFGLIVKRYGPWVLAAIVLVTMMSVSGSRRR